MSQLRRRGIGRPKVKKQKKKKTTCTVSNFQPVGSSLAL